MNWLALIFAIELGWLPQGDLRMYEPVADEYYTYTRAELDHSFYFNVDARVLFAEHFYVGGEMRTTAIKMANKLDSFSPQKILYVVKGGIEWGIVDVFARWYCTHPVIPYAYNYDIDLKWESSYTEIGIRLEGRIE